MTLVRPLKWIAGGLLSLVLLPVLFVAVFGWNWLRGPLASYLSAQWGRPFAIGGDLRL